MILAAPSSGQADLVSSRADQLVKARVGYRSSLLDGAGTALTTASKAVGTQ